jgi:hypothetical protein
MNLINQRLLAFLRRHDPAEADGAQEEVFLARLDAAVSATPQESRAPSGPVCASRPSGFSWVPALSLSFTALLLGLFLGQALAPATPAMLVKDETKLPVLTVAAAPWQGFIDEGE